MSEDTQNHKAGSSVVEIVGGSGFQTQLDPDGNVAEQHADGVWRSGKWEGVHLKSATTPKGAWHYDRIGVTQGVEEGATKWVDMEDPSWQETPQTPTDQDEAVPEPNFAGIDFFKDYVPKGHTQADYDHTASLADTTEACSPKPKHEVLSDQFLENAQKTKADFDALLDTDMGLATPKMTLESTSQQAKQAIAASSSPAKVDLGNSAAFDALAAMGVSPKRPEILAIMSPPTSRPDNSVPDLLKARRFERAMMIDNIVTFNEAMKLVPDVQAAMEVSQLELDSITTELKNEITALSLMRGQIDAVGYALDIGERSEEIMASAKVFYNIRRDSIERDAAVLPSEIRKFVEVYVGHHQDDVSKMSNTKMLFEIIRAIWWTSEHWVPNVHDNTPSPGQFPNSDAFQIGIIPNLPGGFDVKEHGFWSDVPSVRKLGLDPNAGSTLTSANTTRFHSSPRRGGYAQYTGGVHSSCDFTGPGLSEGWTRLVYLCSVLSNELIMSAGIGNVKHSQLGKRFGINSGKPLKNLLGDVMDLPQPSPIFDANIAVPGSLLDYLVIGEEGQSGAGTTVSRVLPFEPGEVFNASGNTGKTYASGREFFVEGPFRSPTGVLGQTDFANFKNYALDFNKLTDDTASYMDRLFALNIPGVGITSEKILVRVLREVQKAAVLFSGTKAGVGADRTHKDQSAAVITTILLSTASKDAYSEDPRIEGDASYSSTPVRITSWRYLLLLLCLQYRDDVDTGLDIENQAKYIKAVEAGKAPPPPETMRDPRFAIPSIAKKDMSFFNPSTGKVTTDSGVAVLFGKARDWAESTAENRTEPWVRIMTDILSGKRDAAVELKARPCKQGNGWQNPSKFGPQDIFQYRVELLDFDSTDGTAQNWINLDGNGTIKYAQTYCHEIHHNLFRPWPGDNDVSFLAAVVRIARELQVMTHDLASRDGEDYSYLDEAGTTLFNGVPEDVLISVVLELFIQCFSMIDCAPVLRFRPNDDAKDNDIQERFGFVYNPRANEQLADTLEVLSTAVENGTTLDGIFDAVGNTVTDPATGTESTVYGSIIPNVIAETKFGPGPYNIASARTGGIWGHSTIPQDSTAVSASSLINMVQRLAKNREFLKMSTGLISGLGDHILDRSLEMESIIETLTGKGEDPDDDLKNYFKVFTNTKLGQDTLKYLTRHQASVKRSEMIYHKPIKSMGSLPRSVFLSKNEQAAIDIITSMDTANNILGPLRTATGEIATNVSTNVSQDSLILVVGIPMGTIDYLTNPHVGSSMSGEGGLAFGTLSERKDTGVVRIKVTRKDLENEDNVPNFKSLYFNLDMNLFVTPNSIGLIDPDLGYGIDNIESIVAASSFHSLKAGMVEENINGVDVLDWAYETDSGDTPQGVETMNMYKNHMYDFLIRRFLFEATGVDFGCSSFPVASKLQDPAIDAGSGWDLWSKMSQMDYININLWTDGSALPEIFAKVSDSYGEFYSLGGSAYATEKIISNTSPSTRTIKNREAESVSIMIKPPRLTPGAFNFFTDLSTSPIFAPNRYRAKILSPTLFDRVFFIPIKKSDFVKDGFSEDRIMDVSFDGFTVEIDVTKQGDRSFGWPDSPEV